jgi:hypothetical protein
MGYLFSTLPQNDMPIAYVIDRFRQRMLTQAEGLITFADLCRHLDAEARDHGIDLPELFDARSARTNVTPEEIRHLVRRVRDMVYKQPFGPTAIVTMDDFAFGMARMFSILVERTGVAIEVFRDLEGAEAWLDERQ